MHGGDIYRNNIHYDFSVNINPLGVPSEVQWVLTEAGLHANKYPDILHENLAKDTAKIFAVPEDSLVFGNGASEIIMALCHALMPKKAMLLAPCFLGYEHCIKGAANDCKILYHQLPKENDFELDEGILEFITSERPEVLFLTNPNNPNGLLIDKGLLKHIIYTCEQVSTTVVLDECFISLTGREKELSFAYDISGHKSLIVLRAFTKSFAIPGVRLGYAICSKASMAEKIRMHLPEWNISIFAQMAGAECLKHRDYVDNAAELIKEEKRFLAEKLTDLGFKVYKSDANFILFESKLLDLDRELINYSILIRDCSDFEGLQKGFYRIAVRQHNENEGLISALEGILK